MTAVLLACLAKQGEVATNEAAPEEAFAASVRALRAAVPPGVRFIVHAGTPKTGTTALQQVLFRSAEALAERGIWYPPSFVSTANPRHRFLDRVLEAADGAQLVRSFGEIVHELPAHTRIVFLSAEGVYHLWSDFPERSKAMIAQLAAALDLEFWVCFREPEAFAVALYAQAVVNPAVRAPYGLDIGLEEMLDSPWFALRLDYLGFVTDVERLIGGDKIRLFRYGADIVERVLYALGVAELTREVARANASLRRPGVDLVRLANRLGLSSEKRAAAIALARRVDALFGDRAERLEASPAAKRRIEELSARDWAVVDARIAAGERAFESVRA